MFTGLIENIGTIERTARVGDDVTLEISCGFPMEDVVLGESIAVNGVCLTVTGMTDRSFTADASVETMRVTALGRLKNGSSVHLERALRVGDRLGGHFVQGHVDGVGRIVRMVRDGKATQIWVDVPGDLAPEVVPKGSITIDGISLTVNEIAGTTLRVTIVPHTETATLLTTYAAGHAVNVETDVIGKHVRRLLGLDSGGVEDVLKRFGYTE